MEINHFDDNSKPDDKSSQPRSVGGRPFDYSGAPTVNGRYNNTPGLPVSAAQAYEANVEQAKTKAASKQVKAGLYLSLVIPAFNEATRLPGTLEQVLKWLESQHFNSEVVVVDDGSSDETVAVVQAVIKQRQSAAGENDNNAAVRCELRLIENPHRGKGFAVRTGMLQSEGDFILFSDADLCTPINEANKLLFWLDQGFDLAIGSREGVGARRHGEPVYRHLMGRVFNLIVRIVTNSPFQDTQCGFKAFTRQSAHDLFHRVQLYGEDTPLVQGAMVTGFDVEVLFLAIKRNYRVKEVPVEWYHVKGSKVSPVKDSLRMLRDIASVRLNDIRGIYRR